MKIKAPFVIMLILSLFGLISCSNIEEPINDTPINPVGPIDPIDPVDPVDPIEPIDPVDPVDPIGPIIPVVPIDPVDETLTLKQVYDKGSLLKNDETGEEVTFVGTYVKAITDNNDKLMLFVSKDSYLCVRVVGGFNDFLKNRYLLCDYKVTGSLTKVNNNVEVIYSTLENVTSTPEKFDYSSISKNVDDIKTIYNSMDDLLLTKKGNGYGTIFTFSGVCLSTDRTDANSKAVIYDNKNLITVIGDKKVCSADEVGKTFTVTGIVSILKNQPAILVLDISYSKQSITLDYGNFKEVTPSYFSKWYHVSDKINDPSYLDFSYLYKVTGYVNIDSGRNGIYFGLTDEKDGNMNDNQIKTSVKGVYLMNYQNQKTEDSYNTNIYQAYLNETKIECMISLYQFDTQNHAWKCFILDSSFKQLEK